MDRARILRAVARRWYVAIAGLLMTSAAIAATFLVFPVQYQATAIALLLPPVSAPGGNPYMELSGMREVTEVLSGSMMSDASKDELKARGLQGKYTVDRDGGSAGPIMVITVDSDSTEAASAGRDLVLQLMGVRLDELQEQLMIRERSRITTKPISVSEESELQWRKPARAVIALAGVGLVGSLAAAVWLDTFLARRSAGQREIGRHRRVSRRKIGPEMEEPIQWDLPESTDDDVISERDLNSEESLNSR